MYSNLSLFSTSVVSTPSHSHHYLSVSQYEPPKCTVLDWEQLDSVPFFPLYSLLSEEQPNEHFKYKQDPTIPVVKTFGWVPNEFVIKLEVLITACKPLFAYFSDIISHQPFSNLSLCQSLVGPLPTMLRTEHRYLRMEGKQGITESHTSLIWPHWLFSFPQEGFLTHGIYSYISSYKTLPEAVAMHTSNPSSREAEAIGGQSVLYSFRARQGYTVRHCLKTKTHPKPKSNKYK